MSRLLSINACFSAGSRMRLLGSADAGVGLSCCSVLAVAPLSPSAGLGVLRIDHVNHEIRAASSAHGTARTTPLTVMVLLGRQLAPGCPRAPLLLAQTVQCHSKQAQPGRLLQYLQLLAGLPFLLLLCCCCSCVPLHLLMP